MKICAQCGKPIDEHKLWFWRRYYSDIEYYCYKCGRSHIDGRSDYGLMTNAVCPPDTCDGNMEAVKNETPR